MMDARTSALRSYDTRFKISGMFQFLIIGVVVVFTAYYTEKPSNNAKFGEMLGPFPHVPASAASSSSGVGAQDDFEYVFHLPTHTAEQYDNYLVVNEFLERPWNLGLARLGFPEIHFTQNEAEFARALWSTESNYWQLSPVDNPDALVDSAGRAIYTSEAGCGGVTQICITSVCPKVLWVELQTNIWCGAKLLRELFDQYGHDYIRVAGAYKGAFLMKDTDGDGIKDTVVFGDDGKEVYDPELFSQVMAVFDSGLLTVIKN